MDVLVGDDRREAAVGDVGAEAVQPGQQPVALLVGEQPRPVQHLRVRLRRGDVIRRQHPVELGRLAQRRKGRRGSVGEPPAPQRPLVGAHGRLLSLPERAGTYAMHGVLRYRRARSRSFGQIPPGGNLGRQPVHVHEALGGGLVEGVALVVGGQVEVVQRFGLRAR